MQSSEKKEKFEREARYKLEIEVKKLQKQNKCLQGIFFCFVCLNVLIIDFFLFEKKSRAIRFKCNEKNGNIGYF